MFRNVSAANGIDRPRTMRHRRRRDAPVPRPALPLTRYKSSRATNTRRRAGDESAKLEWRRSAKAGGGHRGRGSVFLRQRARYHRATARSTCICGWCNYVRARASVISVRFGALCGLKSDISRGPSRARKRHMRRSKRHLYSITSSARASSIGGTSRPSARAVATLITNSNLVGCTTGRSAGLVRGTPRACSISFQLEKLQCAFPLVRGLSR